MGLKIETGHCDGAEGEVGLPLSSGGDMRKLMFAGGGALLLVLIAGSAYWFTPSNRAARLCDAAIKDHLKAPSTYRRISAATHLQPLPPTAEITFEADNDFGVPIRHEAYCRLSDDIQSAEAYLGTGL